MDYDHSWEYFVSKMQRVYTRLGDFVDKLVWDEYSYCQIFDIVQCDERRHETTEYFASYFSDTLLKIPIYFLQASFSSEKKKRGKVGKNY